MHLMFTSRFFTFTTCKSIIASIAQLPVIANSEDGRRLVCVIDIRSCSFSIFWMRPDTGVMKSDETPDMPS